MDTHERAGKRPVVVGVGCSTFRLNEESCYSVFYKYVDTLFEHFGMTSLLIPPLIEPRASPRVRAVLSRLDGLLLTGGLSNVDPALYGQPTPASMPLDRDRDRSAIALIAEALAMRLPVLGICRGAQEMNVALGGSLHQDLDALSGLRHGADRNKPANERYGHSHRVRVTEDGILGRLSTRIASSSGEFQVNSLHRQGIRHIAPGLRIEAVAPDGLVEAISAPDAEFFVGVQWHPEWLVEENPVYAALFESFREACVAYRHRQGADRL